ncbi:hypothetical protein QW060_06055 [Myroides ceti]|uniref:Uncharacterized protein n=1 Tax=Paenimyroides ceti TaxID=395087 RepID=A0ABT8CQA5_9FLAO|nr:hypothetical protein [Paenimyroides ceti]MDN3706693.1 hypothetical protein [Paenimyroides ceti]
MPLLLKSVLSIRFCINPLIKFILQSKPLFLKVLQCNGVPKTAFERQTLPTMYNKENNIGSLYQISGRNAIRLSFRADRQHSEMQTILQAGLQDCKISGLQDFRIARKQT